MEYDSIRSRYLSIVTKQLKNHPDKDYCFQLVCVGFKGSRFVNVGFNKPKTDSYMRRLKEKYNLSKMYAHADSEWTSECVHAEINCIKSNDCDTVVVARKDKKGNFALAKPCLFCEHALRQEGVKTVFYSTTKGFRRMKL